MVINNNILKTVKKTDPRIIKNAIRRGYVPIPKRIKWYDNKNIPVQYPNKNNIVIIAIRFGRVGIFLLYHRLFTLL